MKEGASTISTAKPTLHLEGYGELQFALQFGNAANRDGTIPFLISWSGPQDEIVLFGLYVPADTIASLPAIDSGDREFVAWLEAVRRSALLAGDLCHAGLRIMAIDLPPALEQISPAQVLIAAKAVLADLIRESGAIVLTVELFRVEQKHPLRLSIMHRVEEAGWGLCYQFEAGLEPLADRRPIRGTRYMAPAIYGTLLSS